MNLSKNKKVLIIAPHADDFEIGMGGTIAKLKSLENQIKLINCIIPNESVLGVSSVEAKKIRKKEAIESAKKLNCEMDILDIDPYLFKFDRETIKIFDQIIRDFKPNHIFMTWENDSHQDHQTLAKILYSASRKNNASLYMYETMIPGGISSIPFHPQLFIDISDFIEIKKDSINCYKSVFENNQNLVDSIISRAQFRGGQIGVKYAEAFQIIKEIIY
jgi:LmbE family N-acetylglucosaminyl deacetylase